MLSDVPRCSQMLQMFQILQILPDVPRCSQMFPDASRCSQMLTSAAVIPHSPKGSYNLSLCTLCSPPPPSAPPCFFCAAPIIARKARYSRPWVSQYDADLGGCACDIGVTPHRFASSDPRVSRVRRGTPDLGCNSMPQHSFDPWVSRVRRGTRGPGFKRTMQTVFFRFLGEAPQVLHPCQTV